MYRSSNYDWFFTLFSSFLYVHVFSITADDGVTVLRLRNQSNKVSNLKVRVCKVFICISTYIMACNVQETLQFVTQINLKRRNFCCCKWGFNHSSVDVWSSWSARTQDVIDSNPTERSKSICVLSWSEYSKLLYIRYVWRKYVDKYLYTFESIPVTYTLETSILGFLLFYNTWFRRHNT